LSNLCSRLEKILEDSTHGCAQAACCSLFSGAGFILIHLQAAAAQTAALPAPSAVFGYGDFTAQAKIEEKFLAVPDARLAGEEFEDPDRRAPSGLESEDRKTAEYVARKFRAAASTRRLFPFAC